MTVYIKEDVRYECCLPLHLFVFLSNIALVEIMLPYLKTIRKLKLVTWSGHMLYASDKLTSGTFARGPYRWCSGWGLWCRGWCGWAARRRRQWWRRRRPAAAGPCSATWSACRRPSPCWTTTTTPCWRATPPSARGPRLRRIRPFPCPCTETTHTLLS